MRTPTGRGKGKGIWEGVTMKVEGVVEEKDTIKTTDRRLLRRREWSAVANAKEILRRKEVEKRSLD